MQRLRITAALCAALAMVSLAGCPITITPGGSLIPQTDPPITIRVINNTDFDIDPGVEFGFTQSSLELLNTGVLEPGDIATATFDCDEVTFLTATEPAQLGVSVEFVLDSLPFFEVDIDYFCGETIEFEFFGNGQDFNVEVTANGEVIF